MLATLRRLATGRADAHTQETRDLACRLHQTYADRGAHARDAADVASNLRAIRDREAARDALVSTEYEVRRTRTGGRHVGPEPVGDPAAEPVHIEVSGSYDRGPDEAARLCSFTDAATFHVHRITDAEHAVARRWLADCNTLETAVALAATFGKPVAYVSPDPAEATAAAWLPRGGRP